jgi:fumarylacetoacetase
MMAASWVDGADGSDFPVQNLPFGVFSSAPKGLEPRVGVAIGDSVLDMRACLAEGLLDDCPCAGDFGEPNLNAFMAQPRAQWIAVRTRLTALLTCGGDPTLQQSPELRGRCLLPLSEVQMHLPAAIGDYTDFYSSREHATNVGTMFRGKDNALQPNWLHLPVGYHGRASSVVSSGTPVVRPAGQLQLDRGDPTKGTEHAPCRLLDFELEMGFFVGGAANRLGTPVDMATAHERIFGFVLCNDWSARDIQKFEYVPLGPFGAKNFATSISPWVVMTEALAPFRCATSAGEQAGGLGARKGARKGANDGSDGNGWGGRW